MEISEMTDSSVATNTHTLKSLVPLSTEHKRAPSPHAPWRVLTSGAVLQALLMAILLTWGGYVLLQLWSPKSALSVMGWLCLAGLIYTLWEGLGALGTQARNWFLRLVLLLFGAQTVIQLSPASQSTKRASAALGDQLLRFLELAGLELMMALLFLVLLARLIERASLLWGTSALPLPPIEGSTLLSIPSDESTITSIDALLKEHFEPPSTHNKELLWAEQGRQAAMGEIWLLLGLLMMLAGAGAVLYAPNTIRWTQVVLGAAPWIVIGAWLMRQTPFVAIGIWREQEHIHLWLYGERDATLQDLLQQQLQPENQSSEENKNPEESTESEEHEDSTEQDGSTEAEKSEDAEDSEEPEEPKDAKESKGSKDADAGTDGEADAQASETKKGG